MAKRAAPLVLACLAGACLPAAARAQGWVEFGDIAVAAGEVSQATTHHGYAEYPIRVRNRSPSAPHEVRLVIPKQRGWAVGPYVEAIARTVRVEPGTEVAVALLQPNLPLGGFGLDVTIDGETPPEG